MIHDPLFHQLIMYQHRSLLKLISVVLGKKEDPTFPPKYTTNKKSPWVKQLLCACFPLSIIINPKPSKHLLVWTFVFLFWSFAFGQPTTLICKSRRSLSWLRTLACGSLGSGWTLPMGLVATMVGMEGTEGRGRRRWGAQPPSAW